MWKLTKTAPGMMVVAASLLLSLTALLLLLAAAVQCFTAGSVQLEKLTIAEWQGLATVLYGLLGLVAGVCYFLARIQLD